MRLAAVSNVSIAGHELNGRVALTCDFEGALYHVWLLPENRDVGALLYKNPRAGVHINGPGYFKTRFLSITSTRSKKIIEAMLAVCDASDLIAGWRERERVRVADEIAVREKVIAAVRMEEAAPQLLAALTNLVARVEHLPGAPPHELQKARLAIADATDPRRNSPPVDSPA